MNILLQILPFEKSSVNPGIDRAVAIETLRVYMLFDWFLFADLFCVYTCLNTDLNISITSFLFRYPTLFYIICAQSIIGLFYFNKHA